MFSQATTQLLARAHKAAGPAAAVKMLTDDVAIQYILADIPLFTVGVFALGAFTFCLILRKWSWLTLCLFASVWMAFAGAILDLVQTLNQDKIITTAFNDNNSVGISITREIAYAISFGLRYLWFWGFVAIQPPGVQSSQDLVVHSGAWSRWGLFGKLIRWVLLVGVLAIASLQTVYRIYTPAAQMGIVYNVESTIQIVVSAIFVLKLLLNTYLVGMDIPGSRSSLRTFLWYLPIIVALLINLGIGVGDIIEYLFSETVLGRFLQAVELYIVVLYTLIVTFYPLRHVSGQTTPKARLNRSSSFHNIPPGGGITPELVIPHPRLPSTDLISAFQRSVAPSEGPSRPSLLKRNSSYTSRLSLWLNRRSSRWNAPELSIERDQDRLLWDKQNDAERGISPVDVDVEVKLPGPSTYEESPMDSEMSPSYIVPQQISAPREYPKSILTGSNAKSASSAVQVPPRARIRFSDAYDVTQEGPFPSIRSPFSQTRTESPIYGLSGIINAQRVGPAVNNRTSEVEDDPRTFFDNSPRESSISGLLRQQDELDKSIAALKLFSTDPSEASSIAGTQRRSLTLISDVGSENDPKRASSHKSVFSLSNFPEPPLGRSDVSESTTRRDSVAITSPPGLPDQSDDWTPEPVPPIALPTYADNQLSVSTSASGDLLLPMMTRNRMNSSGTHLEITSFIGHLTQPGHRANGSSGTVATSADAAGPFSRLQAIIESPIPPLSQSNPTDIALPQPSPFPVSPTGWMPDTSGASYTSDLRLSSIVPSIPPRRALGLPSGPKLPSPARERASASPGKFF